MLEAFQNGEDIHARTARLVFGAETDEELKEARRFAKIVKFAIAMRSSLGAVAASRYHAAGSKESVADYTTLQRRRRYMEEVPLRAREHGYVRSYTAHSPADRISVAMQHPKAAEREAINMPFRARQDIVKSHAQVDEEFKRESLRPDC